MTCDKMCNRLDKLEDEDIETLYVWLYNDNDKSTCKERRLHLISYVVSYYQFKSAKELLPRRLRRNFIEKILFISSYLQRVEVV